MRFILQPDVDIHTVAVDELRQDVAIEGVVPVGPIDHLFAVHIDIGVTHRTVEHERVEAVFVHRHAGMIVPFSHPRQTAASAGLPSRFLLAVLHDDNLLQVVVTVERTADSPIVRYLYGAPGGVHICYLVRRFLPELPCRQQSADG